MKRFAGNTAVKIISFILLVIICFSLLLSGMGVCFLVASDVYYDGGEGLKEEIYNYYIDKKETYVNDMIECKFAGEDVSGFEKSLAYDKTNYRFKAVDEEGKECGSNLNAAEDIIYSRKTDMKLFVPTDRTINTHNYIAYDHLDITKYIEEFEGEGRQVLSTDIYQEQEFDTVKILLKLRYWEGEYKYISIESGVAKQNTAKDMLYYTVELADFCIGARIWIFIYMAVALGVVIFLFVILMKGAGIKNGKEDIQLCWFHKIPFDLYLLANVIFGIYLFEVLEANAFSDLKAIISISVGFVVYLIMALVLCITFSARVKKGGWYKNTILFFVLKCFVKVLRLLLKGLTVCLNNISLFYKTLLAIILLTLTEFLFLNMGIEDYILFWVFKKLILVPFVIYCVICMRKLQISARKMAQGDTSEKVDTKMMILDFKEHGDNLNGMGDGLTLALEKSMKSERMKTELITNVSHDIKTPLTSIINYVDLLKREGVTSDNAVGYVEVLDRQAKRLKRLTEDLVEASKASTGNLHINLDDTDIGVLLIQATGEYEERLNEKSLNLVLECEEGLKIKADGRHLWRVFDNLMNNICKYAQPDTRVYITAKRKGEKAEVIFKNISCEQLNIAPEELTERFVRGDRSRYTEGSGLGLSIAKSLTELQGGSFDIIIDGDLFKVTVTV